jgi:hypothetical protein
VLLECARDVHIINGNAVVSVPSSMGKAWSFLKTCVGSLMTTSTHAGGLRHDDGVETGMSAATRRMTMPRKRQKLARRRSSVLCNPSQEGGASVRTASGAHSSQGTAVILDEGAWSAHMQECTFSAFNVKTVADDRNPWRKPGDRLLLVPQRMPDSSRVGHCARQMTAPTADSMGWACWPKRHVPVNVRLRRWTVAGVCWSNADVRLGQMAPSRSPTDARLAAA